jgi:hypothetical protein
VAEHGVEAAGRLQTAGGRTRQDQAQVQARAGRRLNEGELPTEYADVGLLRREFDIRPKRQEFTSEPVVEGAQLRLAALEQVRDGIIYGSRRGGGRRLLGRVVGELSL